MLLHYTCSKSNKVDSLLHYLTIMVRVAKLLMCQPFTYFAWNWVHCVNSVCSTLSKYVNSNYVKPDWP